MGFLITASHVIFYNITGCPPQKAIPFQIQIRRVNSNNLSYSSLKFIIAFERRLRKNGFLIVGPKSCQSCKSATSKPNLMQYN